MFLLLLLALTALSVEVFNSHNYLHLAQAQAESTSESPEKKRRDELRWFPADNISDCDAEPGIEQVQFLQSVTLMSLR